MFGNNSSSFAPGLVNTLSAEDIELLNAAAALQEADFVIKHVWKIVYVLLLKVVDNVLSSLYNARLKVM